MLIVIGLVLLNVYAGGLVLARGWVYRGTIYRPMLWNLFLSVLPVIVLVVGGLTSAVAIVLNPAIGYVYAVCVALVWLMLLPNASYLITELNQSHREPDDPTPLWYDIILVITLAMSGVVNTVLNVFMLHLFVALTFFGDSAPSFLRAIPLASVAIVMVMIAFGMYLGRFPRFNSWDLRHPVGFIVKLRRHFVERGNRLACAGFTGTYAVFLMLMYLVMAGPMIDGLVDLQRMRNELG